MLSKKGWRKKGRNNKSEKKGGEGRGRKRKTVQVREAGKSRETPMPQRELEQETKRCSRQH